MIGWVSDSVGIGFDCCSRSDFDFRFALRNIMTIIVKIGKAMSEISIILIYSGMARISLLCVESPLLTSGIISSSRLVGMVDKFVVFSLWIYPSYTLVGSLAGE